MVLCIKPTLSPPIPHTWCDKGKLRLSSLTNRPPPQVFSFQSRALLVQLRSRVSAKRPAVTGGLLADRAGRERSRVFAAVGAGALLPVTSHGDHASALRNRRVPFSNPTHKHVHGDGKSAVMRRTTILFCEQGGQARSCQVVNPLIPYQSRILPVLQKNSFNIPPTSDRGKSLLCRFQGEGRVGRGSTWCEQSRGGCL